MTSRKFSKKYRNGKTGKVIGKVVKEIFYG